MKGKGFAGPLSFSLKLGATYLVEEKSNDHGFVDLIARQKEKRGGGGDSCGVGAEVGASFSATEVARGAGISEVFRFDVPWVDHLTPFS